MKNLRTTINKELDKLDLKWRALPLRTQFRYVLVLFTFYLVMGIGMLLKVFYDLGRENRSLAVRHIELPPVVKKESTQERSKFNPNNQKNGRERE